MKAKVVLNMNDSSALVTVAMLSTLLNERNSDYLDIISPFVLTLLPPKTGERVDTGKIILALKEQYGFEEFPIHVLTKILNRYSKQKYGYLEKRYGNYYVKMPYARERFAERQQSIREAQVIVMERLQNFLQENSKYTNITVEKARELFLLFLEQKGLAFIDGINDLKTITNRNYDIFQVARFILAEHEKQSEINHHIEEVVRGFFVYKSVYFFGREGVASLTPRMKDTVVYFDTRLLIETLGYNTHEGMIAAKELISLIRESGGTIKTFSHLVEEVDGILFAYSKSIVNKASFSLQYLLQKNYNEVDITRLRASLKTNLNKLDIEICDPIHARELSNDEYVPLQVNELSTLIQNAFGQISQTTRSDNDVLSITSIYHLRGNARCSSFEGCRAVMATTNLRLTSAVQEFYRNKSTHDVSFVVSDIDLTAILWLRSWDKRSTLPRMILLENAYAACQPTAELLTAFGTVVEKLRGEGSISDDEALLLRTLPAPRDDLLSITQNDTSNINEKTVMEVFQRYVKSLTSKQNDEIVELRTELQQQRERENSRKREAINAADIKAKQEADNLEKILKISVKIFSIVLIFAGSITLVINQLASERVSAWNAILAGIGILGLIDIFRSRNGYISKKITLTRNWYFSKIHAKEMERVNEKF